MGIFRRLSQSLYGLISFKVFLAALLLFLFFLGFILPREAQRLERYIPSGESPDTSLIYSSHDLYRMAHEYGEDGRSYYIRSRFTFDLLWPLIYLFFLVSSMSMVWGSLDSLRSWRMVNLLPFGGLIFDYLENGMASIVMYRYPLSSPIPASLAPIFTFVKWVFVGGSFFLLLLGILLYLVGRLKEREEVV